MEKKVFRFHAKRGQHGQVIDLLKQFGTPWTTNTAEGVRVFVELPNGVSKRSVDKMLRDAGVPGAASCKNLPLVRVGREYDLDAICWDMAQKGHVGKKIKISVKGRRMITGVVTCSTSDCYPGYGYYLG